MEIDDVITYYPIGENLAKDVNSWLIKDPASGTVTYYGYALTTGADQTKAVWKIRKETTSGNDVFVTYADGDGQFDNVWNNRASLTYK